VLVAADLVLTGVDEEVVDVLSVLQVRLDGGGRSPVVAVINFHLASLWTLRDCAGRRRCRPCGDVNRACVWKLRKFTYRSLGSCLFISFSSRVLYVKGIVIFYFI
jgi:hypothetical protein